MLHAQMLRRTAAVAATLSATLLLSATAAQAAEPGEVSPDAVQEFLFGASQVAANRVAASEAVGSAATAVARHLDEQVRSGHPVDITEFDVIAINVRDQGVLGAIVRHTDEVLGLGLLRGTDPDGNELVSIGGAVAHVGIDLEPTLSGSYGYDGGKVLSGTAYMDDGQFDCNDFFYDAKYSATQDHYVYDCYEKWHPGGSYTQHAYNRYTKFDPADNANGLHGDIVDATVRSRPWNTATYKARVTGGPYNYIPTPQASCTEKTFGLTLGPASLGFPYQSCSTEYEILTNGTEHQIGNDWDGRRNGQVYLDVTARFTTTTTPVFADYHWMTVQYCANGTRCGSYSPSNNYIWYDTGWPR